MKNDKFKDMKDIKTLIESKISETHFDDEFDFDFEVDDDFDDGDIGIKGRVRDEDEEDFDFGGEPDELKFEGKTWKDSKGKKSNKDDWKKERRNKEKSREEVMESDMSSLSKIEKAQEILSSINIEEDSDLSDDDKYMLQLALDNLYTIV